MSRAKRVLETLIEADSYSDPKAFIKYFRSFYGPEGLYPLKGVVLKDEDILKGIKARGADFDGDTIDRETIRDMILHKDFSRKWNPLG